MLTALIPLVANIVVSTSAGIAVDSAVKMLVPVGIKALPAFGIKIGTAIVGGVISMRVGNLIQSNAEAVLAELTTGDQEESIPEDN